MLEEEVGWIGIATTFAIRPGTLPTGWPYFVTLNESASKLFAESERALTFLPRHDLHPALGLPAYTMIRMYDQSLASPEMFPSPFILHYVSPSPARCNESEFSYYSYVRVGSNRAYQLVVSSMVQGSHDDIGQMK